MKNGYKIIDMDTHFGPSTTVMYEYVDPSFRPRLPEMDVYRGTGQVRDRLRIGTLPYTRFPGTVPSGEETKVTPGGRTANEVPGRMSGGRMSGSSEAGGHHRIPPQPEVENRNVEGRLQDMDLEGRDVDYIFPSGWVTAIIGIPDVTLTEGLYRALHNFYREYCSHDPHRLKGIIHVPGNDVEWAVSEIKSLAGEPWVGGVRPNLPEGLPVDHPDLDPLWEVMNDLDLPFAHHSNFFEPPYWPGYRDIWGNAAVARTAAHPWGAARLCSYLIVGRLFDRFPNLRAIVAEVGHGWLPHWLIRLGEMINYVSGTTPPLDYKPIEYAQMGRFTCSAEPMEGPEMTKACIDILGDGCLMHQSDYPHPEAHFPDTAQMVMDWPFWKDMGETALRNHMSGNAEKFFGSRL